MAWRAGEPTDGPVPLEWHFAWHLWLNWYHWHGPTRTCGYGRSVNCYTWTFSIACLVAILTPLAVLCPHDDCHEAHVMFPGEGPRCLA